MLEDWLIRTMYATKRRRRTVKSVKTPSKEPPKSNPSKRHRERLNGELDHLASLLPFEQSVISKLDKLSILRLAVSYLRTKSFFQSVLPTRYGIESHLMSRTHLFHEPGFSEGESILQALYGFLFVVTCEGEVFFASRTVEQYLGFHQSDIIHQSVMELIHSEDREEFKRQLTWNSMLPSDKSGISLHETMLPENMNCLHRSFTVRFRCLLDNTSGFITLEINGWIRVLHGQGPRADEPQLALFATCSPFGPLSLFDIPSREMTFKTKHKMDYSPVTMDNRGKSMFAYSDHELANKSGYDLIHPDDLNYFSSAHQELIKTGSSGLISYRWQTKHQQWLWLQSSCKVIYKNSKPDFIICTHRQLTEDEGHDLFGKRGNEFKLPYPLLDIDMCTGFGFGEDELTTKSKSSKNKKKTSAAAASGNNSNSNGKKRKAACIIGGIPSYCSYPTGFTAYDGGGGELKPPESVYYGTNNFGFEPDMYRAQGYCALTPTVYPPTDPYRLDVDKHGYFLDHRQYQHSSFTYPNNGYTDFVQPAKYGYDVPKYGIDSYSLDLSKRVDGGDITQFHPDVRRYAFDYHHPPYSHIDHSLHSTDRFSTGRLSTIDAVDLRNPAAIFGSNSFMNTVEAPCSSTSPCSASSVFKNVQTPNNKEQSSKLKLGNMDSPSMSLPFEVSNPLPHNTVIKCTRQPDSSLIPTSQNLNHSLPHGNSDNGMGLQTDNRIPWNSCSKSGGDRLSMSTVETSQQGSDLNGTKCRNSLEQRSDNSVGGDCTDDMLKAHENSMRLHDKDSTVTGIPVSVVKQSPWLQASNNNNTNINNNINNNNGSQNHINTIGSTNNNLLMGERDWVSPSDYYNKTARVLFPDPCHSVKHLGLKVFERGDNPLLSFSEMTHTLMSSTH
ncbi:uncharacterized protein LOC131930762 [Physella acuta]|uniref:uncharacterized protein LOC131930762 n=1 Tax=Physella acuta TaxID=109671 RepID=UPI0027DD6AA2|nr:uncharacterized protein LOC131930762 [Physella acuta]